MDLKMIYERIMADKNLSVKEFASSIGVNESAIYKVKRGVSTKMHKDTAVKINKVYPEYSINVLMQIESTISKSTKKLKTVYSEGHIAIKADSSGIVTLDEIIDLFVNHPKECNKHSKFFLWRKNEILEGSIEVLKNKFDIK